MANFEIVAREDFSDVTYMLEIRHPQMANAAQPGQFVIVMEHEHGERIPLTIADFDRDEGHDHAGHPGGRQDHPGNAAELPGRHEALRHGRPDGHPEPHRRGEEGRVRRRRTGRRAHLPAGARLQGERRLRDRRRGVPQPRTSSSGTTSSARCATSSSSAPTTARPGIKGLVTEGIKQAIAKHSDIDEVVAIGPPIMMKGCAEATRAHGIRTMVSLNPVMVDGTGMCGGCRVKIGEQIKFACVDGPDFDGHQVDFDDLMARLARFKPTEKEALTALAGELPAARRREPPDGRRHRRERDGRRTSPEHRTQTMAKKKTIRTIPQERTACAEQPPLERAQQLRRSGLRLQARRSAASRPSAASMCPEQPCVAGCPVSIDIPKFIQKIAEKNYHGAYDVITDTNLLPAVCGRVCPQENQCEGVCTVGDTLEPVAIGRLERFVGDMAIQEGWSNIPLHRAARGFRVGIVGSGPAGMACAADMAKAGCDVTVYEAFHEPGGVLKYGIPDFRLPNSVIDAEIDKLRQLGIKFECNTLVGRLFTIEQMVTEMGFHAVFIGTGAGYPSFMGIPGESLNGVLSANELLTRCNLMRARDFPNFDTPLQPGKRVTVIGAGNTAMDAMRVSLRLGAEKVYCVYRRTHAEAPARAEEIHHAEEEGIEFHWLTTPVELLGDGQEPCARCAASAWSWASPTTRAAAPRAGAGSEFEIETDMVVFAIGTNANPILGQTSKLKLNKWGYIATDENLATSIAGVFAGGDIVTGAATVIEAMGAGRKAARAMKAYLGLRDTDSIYAPDARAPTAGLGSSASTTPGERYFVTADLNREDTCTRPAGIPRLWRHRRSSAVSRT